MFPLKSQENPPVKRGWLRFDQSLAILFELCHDDWEELQKCTIDEESLPTIQGASMAVSEECGFLLPSLLHKLTPSCYH
jgi:hypothetical protein